MLELFYTYISAFFLGAHVCLFFVNMNLLKQAKKYDEWNKSLKFTCIKCQKKF